MWNKNSGCTPFFGLRFVANKQMRYDVANSEWNSQKIKGGLFVLQLGNYGVK